MDASGAKSSIGRSVDPCNNQTLSFCTAMKRAQTLYDKLWDAHLVRQEPDGTGLIYIDRHLVHEVTSPQAFEGLRLTGRAPWRSDSIVATADHNTPTRNWEQGIRDPISRTQVETLMRTSRRSVPRPTSRSSTSDRA